MNPHSMSYVLNKHRIKFQKWNEHAKGWRYIDPPKEVVEKLLAKGTWPRLPHVVGVITVPTLRPDGTVLCPARPGNQAVVCPGRGPSIAARSRYSRGR